MTLFSGKFQLRRGTSALWLSSDPVLALGEPGLDTDLMRLKVGDGVKAFSALPWFTNPSMTFPPTTSWSALNSGTVTVDVNGRLITLAGTSGDNWKGEIRTLTPASNYTALFYFDWASPTNNFIESGIVLRNSGSGSLITFGAWESSANGGLALATLLWNSPTSYNSTGIMLQVYYLSGMPNWLRIRDDATTRFYEYSNNGIDWIVHSSTTRTTFITPDQIGWGTNANGTGFTAITRLRSFSGVA